MKDDINSAAPETGPEKHLILFCDVVDPKRQSQNIRDLFREALTHRDVSEKVSKIVGDGEDLGHKAIVWDEALKPVADFLGERLDPYKHLNRYIKGNKLRSVVRERCELDKQWKLTGQKSKRLTGPSNPSPE